MNTVVEHKAPDESVYVICPEKFGKPCVLHQNLLSPCLFLPASSKLSVRKQHQKQPAKPSTPINMPPIQNRHPSADSDDKGYPNFTLNQLTAVATGFSN